jgi:hypothetical protein
VILSCHTKDIAASEARLAAKTCSWLEGGQLFWAIGHGTYMTPIRH